MDWKSHEDTKYDLYRYGFVPNYYVWTAHGERHSEGPSQQIPNHEAVNLVRNMVIDAAGPNFFQPEFQEPIPQGQDIEPPNPEAKRFYDLLSKADEPLFQGCEKHSTLSAISRMLSIKSDFNMTNITNDQLKDATEKKFQRWLRDYVLNPLNLHLVTDQIINIALGPSRYVRTWHMYYVNGFNFHTLYHSSGRRTTNTDVCVIGEDGDYYGQLVDVIELVYTGCSQLNTLVLFKCEWFDPSKNQGWRIHNEFGLVDVNHKKKLSKYDPFIMAHQALQVYLIRYPSLRRNKVDWWAVCKTKARSTIVAPSQSIDFAYQEDSTTVPFIVSEHDELEQLLCDVGNLEEVNVQQLEYETSEEEEDDEDLLEEDVGDDLLQEEEDRENDEGDDSYSDDF